MITNEELISFCAEMLGGTVCKLSVPETLRYPVGGITTYIAPLGNLNDVVPVADATRLDWHLSGSQVKVLEHGNPDSKVVVLGHDRTARSMARTLILALYMFKKGL